MNRNILQTDSLGETLGCLVRWSPGFMHYLVVAHVIDVDQDDVRARTDGDRSKFEEA